jgi:hypothetical protein
MSMPVDDRLTHEYAPAGCPALRLRIGPVEPGEAALWQALLGRLPAVDWAALQDQDEDAAGFLLGVPSISRLHVQLNHLADKMDARFEPTESGELRITMRPATEPASAPSAWSRTMAERAGAWQHAAALA